MAPNQWQMTLSLGAGKIVNKQKAQGLAA